MANARESDQALLEEIVAASDAYASNPQKEHKERLARACDAAITWITEGERALHTLIDLLFRSASHKLFQPLLRPIRQLASSRPLAVSNAVNQQMSAMPLQSSSPDDRPLALAKPVKALLPLCARSSLHRASAALVLESAARWCAHAPNAETQELREGLTACADLLCSDKLEPPEELSNDAFTRAAFQVGSACVDVLNERSDQHSVVGTAAGVCLARSLILLIQQQQHHRNGNCSLVVELSNIIFADPQHRSAFDKGQSLREAMIAHVDSLNQSARAYLLIGVLHAQIDASLAVRTPTGFHFVLDGVLPAARWCFPDASLRCLVMAAGLRSLAKAQNVSDGHCARAVADAHVSPFVIECAEHQVSASQKKVLEELASLAKAQSDDVEHVSRSAVKHLSRTRASNRTWLRVATHYAETLGTLSFLKEEPRLIHIAVELHDRSASAAFFKSTCHMLRRACTFETYCSWLWDPIASALQNVRNWNRSMRSAVKHAVLSHVLGADYDFGVALLKHFCECKGNTPAIALLLHVIRSSGCTHGRPSLEAVHGRASACVIPAAQLRRASTHADLFVRLDVLSACGAHALGSEFLGELECALLRRFFTYSFALEDAGARSEVLGCVDTIVQRLRAATLRLRQERLWSGSKAPLHPDQDESSAMARSHTFLNFLLQDVACEGLRRDGSQEVQMLSCEVVRRLLSARLPQGVLHWECAFSSSSLVRLLAHQWPKMRHAALRALLVAAPQAIETESFAEWTLENLHDVSTDAGCTLVQALAERCASRAHHGAFCLHYSTASGSGCDRDNVWLEWRRDCKDERSGPALRPQAFLVWAEDCLECAEHSLQEASDQRAICVAPLRALRGIARAQRVSMDEEVKRRAVRLACRALALLRWAVADQTLVGALVEAEDEGDGDDEEKEGDVTEQSATEPGGAQGGLLRSCWFTCKAAALFLQDLFANRAISTREKDDNVRECAFELLEVLRVSKHRGVTERSGRALRALCHRVHSLILPLWKELRGAVQDGSQPLESAIQRSGGLPICFISLATSAWAHNDTGFLRRCGRELEGFICDVTQPAIVRIHFLNLLAAGMDQGFSRWLCADAGTLLGTLLALMSSGNVWEARNAAMRVFASVCKIVKSFDAALLRCEMPSLCDAVSSELERRHCSSQLSAMILISQCKPLQRRQRGSWTLSAGAWSALVDEASNERSWRSRTLAARAYAVCIAASDAQEYIDAEADCIAKNHSESWNGVHGALLRASALLALRAQEEEPLSFGHQFEPKRFKGSPAPVQAAMLRCISQARQDLRLEADWIAVGFAEQDSKRCGSPLLAHELGWLAGNHVAKCVEPGGCTVCEHIAPEMLRRVTHYELPCMLVKRLRDCEVASGVRMHDVYWTALSSKNCTLRRRCLQLCNQHPHHVQHLCDERLLQVVERDEARVAREAAVLAVTHVPSCRPSLRQYIGGLAQDGWDEANRKAAAQAVTALTSRVEEVDKETHMWALHLVEMLLRDEDACVRSVANASSPDPEQQPEVTVMEYVPSVIRRGND